MWLLYLLASFRPSYASHSSPSSFSVRSVLDLQNQNTSAILNNSIDVLGGLTPYLSTSGNEGTSRPSMTQSPNVESCRGTQNDFP